MRRIFALFAAVVLFGAAPAPVQHRDLQAALRTMVSINATKEDVYDLAGDLSEQAGIPIVIDHSVEPQWSGLALGRVPLSVALSALCQRFGWLGHLTPDGILVLGPAATMEERYGASGTLPFGVAQRTYVLRNMKPDDAERILRQALPGGTVVAATNNAVTVVASADETQAADALLRQVDADANTATAFVPVHYRTPSNLIKTFGAQIPSTLLVTPDDESHSIILRGTPGEVAALRTLIARTDVPLRSCSLRVTVYDYTPVNDQSDVGIEFGGATIGQGSSSGTSQILIGNAVRINATLNALVSSGRASIISRPNLSGLDGQPEKLQVGTSFYLTSIDLRTGAQQVTQEETGVIGDVTPDIGGGFMTLKTHLEVSDLGAPIDGIPTVHKEMVQETVRVRSGDAMVIGGLMKDTDSETVSKIPFLADLPILGPFFRDRQRQHVRNQLVFVIEPTITAPVLDTEYRAGPPPAMSARDQGEGR
ncbi:hypothetical protein EPN44_14275 [bacterium]|nr:MAG: hypothetical protein EPN44_14275 [bacterium]